MDADVEDDAGEGRIAPFDDGDVGHRRPERRRQHGVVAALAQYVCCGP